jgi:hypothetical protein
MSNDSEATDTLMCCKISPIRHLSPMNISVRRLWDLFHRRQAITYWIVDFPTALKQICCEVEQMWITITLSQARQRILLCCSPIKHRISECLSAGVPSITFELTNFHQTWNGLIACHYSHATYAIFNPLNTEINPIRHLLALLGAHHILHVSRIRVNNKNSAMVTVRELLRWETT